MTGYTVHTGTNEKFAAGWDHIFSGGQSKKAVKKAAESSKKGEAKSKKKSAAKVKRGK